MSQHHESTLTDEQQRSLLELLQKYESALKALHEKAIDKGYAAETIEEQHPSRPKGPGRSR